MFERRFMLGSIAFFTSAKRDPVQPQQDATWNRSPILGYGRLLEAEHFCQVSPHPYAYVASGLVDHVLQQS